MPGAQRNIPLAQERTGALCAEPRLPACGRQVCAAAMPDAGRAVPEPGSREQALVKSRAEQYSSERGTNLEALTYFGH